MATSRTRVAKWGPSATWPNRGQTRPKGGSKFGSYGKHLLGGFAVAALGSLYGDQWSKTRPNLDGYKLAVVCGPAGGRWGVPGNCGTFPAVKPGPGPVSGRPLNISNWQYVGPRNPQQDDWAHMERWTRVSAVGLPISVALPVPFASSDAPPGTVGLDKPGRWIGIPEHVPYAILPRLRNNYWPQWRSTYNTMEQVARSRPIGVETGGWGIPGRAQIPSWVIDVKQPAAPGRASLPSLSSYASQHVLARPQPKEKEVKVKTLNSKGARFIRAALNAVTEAKDFVDALYSALPPAYKIKRQFVNEDMWGPYAKEFMGRIDDNGEYRRGRVRYTNAAGYEITPRNGRSFTGGNVRKQFLKPLSPQEKARAIWAYKDKMDHKYVARALEAVFANQREDKAFGTLGKFQQRASRRVRFGIGRGGAL